ncbi:MAG: DUF4474 domain-containing protein [Lachnospira sp.]
MSPCAQKKLLDELMQPFGFLSCPQQNVITSDIDSWQRTFGYTRLFDYSAPHFKMVFDCEPVYFDYDNRTWLIEFWKGQYGISCGAEIGIYRADTILSRTGLPVPALKAFPIPSCCRCPCSFFIKADHCFASDRPTGG